MSFTVLVHEFKKLVLVGVFAKPHMMRLQVCYSAGSKVRTLWLELLGLLGILFMVLRNVGTRQYLVLLHKMSQHSRLFRAQHPGGFVAIDIRKYT